MTTSGTRSPSSSVISLTPTSARTIDNISKPTQTTENNSTLLWKKKTTNQPFSIQDMNNEQAVEAEQGAPVAVGEEYDRDNSFSAMNNYHHRHRSNNSLLLRRPRAETMPTQSTSFPYINDNLPLVIDSNIASNYNNHQNMLFDTSNNNQHQHHQLQHHNWINDVLLTSPTTPTTDQLLKGDDNNTIASTFASLGLNDDSSSANNSNRMIHTSHSYSSLSALCENQQQEQQQQDYNVYNRSIGTEDLRSSVINLRQQQQHQHQHQHQHNRPRALSSVVEQDHLHHQQQQQQRSIWSSTTNNKPFLRSSNSSADLLEMIARQRKTTTANNSPTSINQSTIYYQEDNMMDNGSGLWTTGESTTTSSPFDQQQQSLYMMDMQNNYHAAGETDSVISSSNNTATATSNQIPSRSLWIGQLDLHTYGANELNMIFSKFGLIESIRILPDRECAFINYSTIEEALRAKDHLINKMSSRLSNHHLVKVGFGKLDTTSAGNSSSSNSVAAMPPSPQAATGNEVGPTRALWVGNIPTNTTQQALASIFSQFGMIESIRVLSHKNCGFINYYTQEEAIRAKRSCHNKEIMGPGTGTVRIGFAKVPPINLKVEDVIVAQQQQHQQQQQQQQQQILTLMEDNLGNKSPFTPIPNTNYASMMDDQQHMMMYMMEMMNTPSSSNTNAMYSAVATERKLIMQEFGEDDSDGPMFDVLHLPTSYYHSIPAAPELGQSRKVDISRLRDIRKRLDTGHITTKELEVIAVECVDELVELCSDYIGNTVIQRLFERCSEMTKSVMLEAVAPFLASIGVHKNGTWAAQKIIDTAKLPAQISIVCGHIKPYVPSLLLDQFGNYVVQCCLGLGPTRNQFIFDAIVDSCWEIAQGRFGARAVRATLESPHVTKRQQKYVAASLVQHALLLATNANGALLLIWLLDTSGIPGRYRVLAPRLLPHLARLCTHKLASLTVLKLINQRQEPDARSLVLESLFFSLTTTVVDEILHDQVHGVSLVQKILSSSYIDLRERQRIAERVKHLLHKLKLQHIQGYKRLIEEINMVMVDSAPGASLGVPPPTNHPFTISPSLAAALYAKYMNEDNSGNDDQQAAAMMANFYAAAAAAAAAQQQGASTNAEEE